MSHAGAVAPGLGLVLGTRGVGVLRALRNGLPPWAVEAFAAVTHLGDTAVLLALAAAVYLAYDRRAGAFVLGALFCGFAVTIALKAWFALPRPPTGLRAVAAAGFGFPSGHALGSTVGWGALAVALERVWSARRRAAVAGLVVVAVSLSRVAIGVHYLVDVVAGVAVGLAVLGVAARWLRDAPLALFGLAAGLAAIAVAVSGASWDAVVLLGAGAGAVTSWQLVEPADRPWGARGVLGAAGGGAVLAGAVAVVDPVGALWFVAAALATAGVLVAPLAAERWLEA